MKSNTIYGLIILYAILGIAISGAMVWVAIHFISKYW